MILISIEVLVKWYSYQLRYWWSDTHINWGIGEMILIWTKVLMKLSEMMCWQDTDVECFGEIKQILFGIFPVGSSVVRTRTFWDLILDVASTQEVLQTLIILGWVLWLICLRPYLPFTWTYLPFLPEMIQGAQIPRVNETHQSPEVISQMKSLTSRPDVGQDLFVNHV